MTAGHGQPTPPPGDTRYAEIIGGEPPSPFAVFGLLAALICALVGVWFWPTITEWWYAAAILALGAVTLAAFAYTGLPGQNGEPDITSVNAADHAPPADH